MQQIVAAVRQAGGTLLITADHGNAEQMLDERRQPHTAHTLNPVAIILADDRCRDARLHSGAPGDIAPTILAMMGLKQPQEMTGTSLLIP